MTMNRAVAAVTLFFLGLSAAYATTYTLTELQPLGVSPTSDSSIAYGINDAAQVVGNSTVTQTGSSIPEHATIWNGTTPTALSTLGGSYSFANGINNTGQVVGYSTTAGDAPGYATIWNTGVPTALAPPSGLISSQAFAINNAGQVVGQAGNTDSHAIIWNGTTPTDLTALNGNAGAALAINNLGQVAGYSYPPGSLVWHTQPYGTALPRLTLAP